MVTSLNKEEILKVANALPPSHRNVTFARGYLHLEKEYIDSLVARHGKDRAKLNQNFIQAWLDLNPNQDQKKKLGEIFKTAARDGYYINLQAVKTALELQEDVSPGNLPELWFANTVGKETVLPTKSVQPSRSPEFIPTYRSRSTRREQHDEHVVKKLEELVTDFLKRRIQIVEIVHGSAVTIQALHSDVILHVPNGVYGIILGNVHANHWRFQHLVKDTDCIIGPICDYYIFHCPQKATKQDNFIIEVPHIVKNIAEVKGNIQVMYQLNGTTVLTFIKQSEGNADSNGTSFSVQKKYIKISTSHFSRFIVTAEGLNCCSSSAEMLLFSHMDKHGVQPLCKVNIYLASLHYELEDYSQKIIIKEESMRMKLMTRQEIELSNDPYDSSKSFIEINIRKSNKAGVEKWKAYEGTNLSLQKLLKDALKYREQHLCRSEPKQLQPFYLLPVNSQSEHRIDIDVTVTVFPEQDEEHPKDPYLIVINPWPTASGTGECELTDAMILSLSEKINQRGDLRKLAISGLSLSDDDLSQCLNENQNDITGAAYNVLKIFRRKFQTGAAAKLELREALRSINMSYFLQALDEAGISTHR